MNKKISAVLIFHFLNLTWQCSYDVLKFKPRCSYKRGCNNKKKRVDELK